MDPKDKKSDSDKVLTKVAKSTDKSDKSTDSEQKPSTSDAQYCSERY